MDATADNEEGFGDGLTAFDEYRGIHYYDSTSAAPRWTSTDPVGKLDAFYLADWKWPGGRLFASSVEGKDSSGNYTAMLARELPKVAFHRLKDPYAGVLHKDQSRSRMNQNSPRENDAYTIEYKNAGQSSTGTIMADAQSFNNDGTKPILIYPNTIATKCADLGFPLAVMQDQVVAHETGHRFDLHHPIRSVFSAEYNRNQLQNLTFGQFSIDPKNPTWVYLRYQIYGYRTPKFASGDQVYLAPFRSFVANEMPLLTITPPAYGAVSSTVYQVQASKPLSLATAILRVQIQVPGMMDWTPRLTFQNSLDFHFTPADVKSVCVRPTSCH